VGTRRPIAAYSTIGTRQAQVIDTLPYYQRRAATRVLNVFAEANPTAMISADQAAIVVMKRCR